MAFGVKLDFHAIKKILGKRKWLLVLYLARNLASEVRRMVMDSFSETMTSIEVELKTRVRGRGADGRARHEERVTGNLAYATFVHDTSRPVDGIPDPHFHIHSYVLNATFDPEENRWKAGFFRDLKADAPFWEAFFNEAFAQVKGELGAKTREAKDKGPMDQAKLW